MINLIFKIITKLFLPPSIFIILLITSSLYLAFINKKLKNNKLKYLAIIFFISGVLIYIFSINITKNILFNSLEKKYKIQIDSFKQNSLLGVDYIVILSSNIKNIKNSYLSSQKGYPERFFLVRLIEGAKLFNFIKSNKKNFNKNENIIIPNIIVCGGVIFQNKYNNIAESEIGKDFLISIGINEDFILTETKSKNTYENLLFAKNKFNLNKKKIIIVSSAFHMKRVSLISDYLNLNYLLYPVDFNSSKGINIDSFIPSNSNLELINLIILEYISIIYHKLFILK
ncbi:MAG: YdcF family protein [Spirochaetes bacterium]|nr:YdcF family protein [Spirochaetota bacterium]